MKIIASVGISDLLAYTDRVNLNATISRSWEITTGYLKSAFPDAVIELRITEKAEATSVLGEGAEEAVLRATGIIEEVYNHPGAWVVPQDSPGESIQ